MWENGIARPIDDEPLTEADHPELHHYTNWRGLEGIVSSGQIWATHFSRLNDSAEVTHLREHITLILAKRIAAFLDELGKTKGRNYRRSLRRDGGINSIAQSEAEKFIGTLYEATFTGGKSAVPNADPYIASFCSHTGDDLYEQENGLLSQWRGYGSNAGFAIVFDTHGISQLLAQESTYYNYPFLSLMDVVYENGTEASEKRFKALVDELDKFVRKFARTGELDPAPLFAPFMTATARLKHRAFREEREVRIVASPMTSALVEKLRQTEPTYKPNPEGIKPILHRGTDGGIPFISLFDGIGGKLPIKRIIVGPSRDQAEQARRVSELVGNGVPIVRSETPYVPPQ